MNSWRAIAAAAACLLVGACQYKAEPPALPALNIYSSYDDKLPGKYLLYVEAQKLDRQVKPSDMNCAAHTYPLNLSASFPSATRQTFENLVAELEVVPAPVDRAELISRGARAIIIVRGEQTNARLRAVPGFWTVGMETDVELIASIQVDGRNGRLLGQTVSGTGHFQSDAGMACEGGAKSLTESATEAMRQSLSRIGEALTNSERVRKGS